MSTTGICDLCGLKIGAQVWTARQAGEEKRFCCEGCKGIWQMLNNVEDDNSAASGPTDEGDRS